MHNCTLQITTVPLKATVKAAWAHLLVDRLCCPTLIASYIMQILNKTQVQALQQTTQSLLSYFGGSQDCQEYRVRSFLHVQDQSDEQPWRADIATLGLWKQQILSGLSAAVWKPAFCKDDPTLAGSFDDCLKHDLGLHLLG